jgi:hypothetical protein
VVAAGVTELQRVFHVAERAVEPLVGGRLFALGLSATKALDSAVRSDVERRTRKVLHFLNLPTATDVRRLHAHLSAVDEHVCETVRATTRAAGG